MRLSISILGMQVFEVLTGDDTWVMDMTEAIHGEE